MFPGNKGKLLFISKTVRNFSHILYLILKFATKTCKNTTTLKSIFEPFEWYSLQHASFNF